MNTASTSSRSWAAPLTLGFFEDTWVSLERPAGLEEMGLFDVATFEPARLETRPAPQRHGKPDQTRDGYWGAKVLSAFTDEDLRLIVDAGKIPEPGRPRNSWSKTLAARRDKIVQLLVRPGAAPGFFHPDHRGNRFPRPGRRKRGYGPRRINRGTAYRLAAVGSDRRNHREDGWTLWRETSATLVPLFGER